MRVFAYFRLANKPHDVGFVEALQTRQLPEYAKTHNHQDAVEEYLATTSGISTPRRRIISGHLEKNV